MKLYPLCLGLGAFCASSLLVLANQLEHELSPAVQAYYDEAYAFYAESVNPREARLMALGEALSIQNPHLSGAQIAKFLPADDFLPQLRLLIKEMELDLTFVTELNEKRRIARSLFKFRKLMHPDATLTYEQMFQFYQEFGLEDYKTYLDFQIRGFLFPGRGHIGMERFNRGFTSGAHYFGFVRPSQFLAYDGNSPLAFHFFGRHDSFHFLEATGNVLMPAASSLESYQKALNLKKSLVTLERSFEQHLDNLERSGVIDSFTHELVRYKIFDLEHESRKFSFSIFSMASPYDMSDTDLISRLEGDYGLVMHFHPPLYANDPKIRESFAKINQVTQDFLKMPKRKEELFSIIRSLSDDYIPPKSFMPIKKRKWVDSALDAVKGLIYSGIEISPNEFDFLYQLAFETAQIGDFKTLIHSSGELFGTEQARSIWVRFFKEDFDPAFIEHLKNQKAILELKRKVPNFLKYETFVSQIGKTRNGLSKQDFIKFLKMDAKDQIRFFVDTKIRESTRASMAHLFFLDTKISLVQRTEVINQTLALLGTESYFAKTIEKSISSLIKNNHIPSGKFHELTIRNLKKDHFSKRSRWKLMVSNAQSFEDRNELKKLISFEKDRLLSLGQNADAKNAQVYIDALSFPDAMPVQIAQYRGYCIRSALRVLHPTHYLPHILRKHLK